MLMKRGEGINRSMMKAVNKKVEDIRDVVSLGYMDLQKRNKSSLLVRIKKLFIISNEKVYIEKNFFYLI